MTIKKIKTAIVGLNIKEKIILGDFEITGIKDMELRGYIFNIKKFIKNGIYGVDYARAITEAKYVDEFYRSNDKNYLNAADGMIKELAEFDIVIFSSFNPLHPELIHNKLKNSIKVIGFIDDPFSTYLRGIPYLWAFDAAYYISPGYSSSMSFNDFFNKIGFKKHCWLPLVTSRNVDPFSYPKLSLAEITNRNKEIIYVGAPVGNKVDKIKKFDKEFKDKLQIFGYWPYNGYYGYLRPLWGESPYFRRVRPIDAIKKFELYNKTKIGLNMHLSNSSAECGNARTYETAAFGMMLLSDRAGLNTQNQIFEEGVEAIYYDSTEQAIELAHYYLRNSKERSRIAMAGHMRARSDYSWENVTHTFLKWLTK